MICITVPLNFYIHELEIVYAMVMKIVVMGVSGSGKSTIGKDLSVKLGLPFFDGDNFHPAENVQKMKAGQPLNDADREPWLKALATLIGGEEGLVLACSALKDKYRLVLSEGGMIHWVYLKGSLELVHERMLKRSGHFMPVGLLESQFSTLEPPEKCIEVDISMSPEEIVSSVLEKLTNLK